MREGSRMEECSRMREGSRMRECSRMKEGSRVGRRHLGGRAERSGRWVGAMVVGWGWVGLGCGFAGEAVWGWLRLGWGLGGEAVSPLQVTTVSDLAEVWAAL